MTTCIKCLEPKRLSEIKESAICALCWNARGMVNRLKGRPPQTFKQQAALERVARFVSRKDAIRFINEQNNA